MPQFPNIDKVCKVSHATRLQKNKEGRMLILYDNDERVAAPAAALMIQKGWENVYVLSGGKFLAPRRFCVHGR